MFNITMNITVRSASIKLLFSWLFISFTIFPDPRIPSALTHLSPDLKLFLFVFWNVHWFPPLAHLLFGILLESIGQLIVNLYKSIYLALFFVTKFKCFSYINASCLFKQSSVKTQVLVIVVIYCLIFHISWHSTAWGFAPSECSELVKEASHCCVLRCPRKPKGRKHSIRNISFIAIHLVRNCGYVRPFVNSGEWDDSAS